MKKISHIVFRADRIYDWDALTIDHKLTIEGLQKRRNSQNSYLYDYWILLLGILNISKIEDIRNSVLNISFYINSYKEIDICFIYLKNVELIKNCLEKYLINRSSKEYRSAIFLTNSLKSKYYSLIMKNLINLFQINIKYFDSISQIEGGSYDYFQITSHGTSGSIELYNGSLTVYEFFINHLKSVTSVNSFGFLWCFAKPDFIAKSKNTTSVIHPKLSGVSLFRPKILELFNEISSFLYFFGFNLANICQSVEERHQIGIIFESMITESGINSHLELTSLP